MFFRGMRQGDFSGWSGYVVHLYIGPKGVRFGRILGRGEKICLGVNRKSKLEIRMTNWQRGHGGG